MNKYKLMNIGSFLICLAGTISTSAAVLHFCDKAKLDGCVDPKDYQLVEEEKVPVRDYAKDNYSDDFWKLNIYNPVEYAKASTDVTKFESNLVAKGAILVDYDSKEVIYEKNADVMMAPASTTKLATAITAVNLLDMDEEIVVGNEVNLIAADSSKAGFKKGEKLTFKELLEGLLLSSGNDAAYIIAKAGGEKLLNDNIAYDGTEITTDQCIKRFVYEMNKNVTDIGAKNSNFTTPDGYDEAEQYTTAEDLSKIAIVALENENLKSIFSMTKAKVKGHDFVTTNELLLKDSSFFYKYAIGMKTGSTDAAGKCLVSAATKDGRTCISVVLNSNADGRYEDSLKLLKFFAE
ncbi:MAG: D-alanyl-D-alanine carboxypeptidase [Lachnospiraceae bacterium]|nr:D-alanyl-D-alanine carboxypeptidase [Lachnospiraceae bacterium]